MLETAGLIYGINTLFKVAVFAQFLDYGLSTFTRDMVAGAAGAVLCTAFLYPLDTLKTWRQLPSITASHSPYQGIAFGFLREAPAAALYVAVFYAVLDALLRCRWDPVGGISISFVAVFLATISGSFFRVVFETMTKRVQFGMRPRRALQTALRRADDGSKRRAYLGATWLTVAARDVVMGASQLFLFRALEGVSVNLMQPLLPGLAPRLLAGSLAGAMAATASAPLDTVATRVICGPPSDCSPSQGPVARVRSAVRAVYLQGGLPALWAGNALRSLYSSLQTCLFFLTVEAIRRVL